MRENYSSFIIMINELQLSVMIISHLLWFAKVWTIAVVFCPLTRILLCYVTVLKHAAKQGGNVICCQIGTLCSITKFVKRTSASIAV